LITGCKPTLAFMVVARATIDSLPEDHVAKLRALYGEPAGEFIHGKHGITHFHLESPVSQSTKRAQIAVLSHGIGTSIKVYDGFREKLLATGFRVLRYDFLGHGWSCAKMDDACSFDKQMMLQQLDEVLNHVLSPGEPVDLWVGHSTGGLLGVLAASLGKRTFSRLALISPAFWKQAPLITKIGDRIPTVVTWLASIKALKLVENGYLENCDNAFAHEGSKFFFPEEHNLAKDDIKKMFSLHPQVMTAIARILANFLRADLLQEAIPVFEELVGRQASAKPQIGLFWGTHDVVVEFAHAKEVLAWPGANDCVKLFALKNLGHEAPLEDPAMIVTEILRFAGGPASSL